MTKRVRFDKNSSDAIRVFVGASGNGEEAEACMALEYSIRANTSVDVDITWMQLSNDPESPFFSSPDAGWHTERWSTPWTALRWAVPDLCGYRGRAIYFDCTTIVRGDVADLLSAVGGGNVAAMRMSGQTIATPCVVWDCAAAYSCIPPLPALMADVGAHQSVGRFFSENRAAAAQLPPGWGVTDVDYARDPDGARGSVYFASFYTQPHARHAIARLRQRGARHWFDEPRLEHFNASAVALFEEALRGARAAGIRVADYEPAVPYGAYRIRGADRVAV